MSSGSLQLGDIKIATEDTGTRGPALFFVHGNSWSSASFARQLEGPLSRRFRLVAIDLPGHGRSSRLEAGRYGPSLYGDVVAACARALAVEDAVFVGHSLGGHVLLEASPRLAHARGFCIFGTPPLGRPLDFEACFLPSLAMQHAFQAELAHEQIAAWAAACVAPGTPPPAGFAEAARETDPRARVDAGALIATGAIEDEVAVVRSLRVPLAILHGQEEQVVRGAWLACLEAPTLWRRAVQVIERAGHCPHVERPKEFNRLINDFVEDCLRSGRSPDLLT